MKLRWKYFNTDYQSNKMKYSLTNWLFYSLLANRGIQRGYTQVNGVQLSKTNSLETFLPGLDFGQKG